MSGLFSGEKRKNKKRRERAKWKGGSEQHTGITPPGGAGNFRSSQIARGVKSAVGAIRTPLGPG